MDEFFLSNIALLPQGLTLFINLCEQKRNILEIRLHLNKNLLVKIIYRIDDNTNQWLLECCNEEMDMDTIFEFMDFRTLATHIVMNQFQY